MKPVGPTQMRPMRRHFETRQNTPPWSGLLATTVPELWRHPTVATTYRNWRSRHNCQKDGKQRDKHGLGDLSEWLKVSRYSIEGKYGLAANESALPIQGP